MRRGSFQAVSPAGLFIEAVTTEPDRLLIIARPTALDAAALSVAEGPVGSIVAMIGT